MLRAQLAPNLPWRSARTVRTASLYGLARFKAQWIVVIKESLVNGMSGSFDLCVRSGEPQQTPMEKNETAFF